MVLTLSGALLCPGLIEARNTRRLPAGLPDYPGQYCPGLIEAFTTPSKLWPRLYYPGQYCPGLIEARCASSKPTHPHGIIRGTTAPASLKQVQLIHLIAHVLIIRGITAPASLQSDAYPFDSTRVTGTRRGNAALGSASAPPGDCRSRRIRLAVPGGVMTWVRVSPGYSPQARPGVMSSGWILPKPHWLTVVSASRVLASSWLKRIPFGVFDQTAVRLEWLDGLSGAGCQE